MNKIIQYKDDHTSIADFIASLDKKMQEKIGRQLCLLSSQPDYFKQPNIKSFKIDKYNGYYELRTRIKKLVRIIFMITPEHDFLLLYGFIKAHERSTQKALELACSRLYSIQTGAASIEEINEKEMILHEA